MVDSKLMRINKDQVNSRYIYHFFKKFFDVVSAIFGLVLLSPIMLVIALLIKSEDKGPVFYKQNRVGKNGKIFKMYKFRSMAVNADELLEKLKDQSDVDGPMFKMRNDPRITRVGSHLRKHSLDELPQLFNVVKGDMSLVGPRPPLPSEVAKYTEYDMQRLYVIPGCTGLWQATDRSSVGFKKMVILDLDYIRRASILLDLKIILRTIVIIFKPNSSF